LTEPGKNLLSRPLGALWRPVILYIAAIMVFIVVY
jgi:hypothetical protein